MKTVNTNIVVSVMTLLGAGLTPTMVGQTQPELPRAYSAEELVLELKQFPATLPGIVRSDGKTDPIEVRREMIYDRLCTMGATAVPALTRGLSDSDVQVRRNVALFLLIRAHHPDQQQSNTRLDITEYLPALKAALQDSDARVRQLAAQAIGAIGPDASSAASCLIALLASPDEGSRNSACIGLSGIGPAAKEALPKLRTALTDPSDDVRRFAQRAIDTIDSQRVQP